MAVLRGRLLLVCLCVLVPWDTNVTADPVRDALAAESEQTDLLARLFDQFHEADGAAVSNKEGNSREVFADSSLRASQMISKTQRVYQNLKRHTQTYRSQLQHSADTINKELTSVNSLLMQAASACVGNKQSLFAMLKESLSTQFDRTLSGPVKQAEQAVDQLESELTEFKEVVENNMDKVKRLQRKCQSSFIAKRRQTRSSMPFPTLASPSSSSFVSADSQSTQPDRIQAVVGSISDSLQQLQTLLRKAVEMGKATADPSGGCVSAFHKMVVQIDATTSSQSSSLQEMDQTAKSAVAATRAYTSVQGMFSQIHDLVMDCERSRSDSDEGVDPAGVRIAGGSLSGNSVLMPQLNLHGGSISDSSTGPALKQAMTFNVGAQSDSRAAAFGGGFISGGGGGGGGGGSTIIFAPYYGRGCGSGCVNDTGAVRALGNLSPAVVALQGLSTGMALDGSSPQPLPGLPPSSDPLLLEGPKSPTPLLPPSSRPEPVMALLDEASRRSVTATPPAPSMQTDKTTATTAPAAAVIVQAQTEAPVSVPPVPRFVSVPLNTSNGTQPELAAASPTQPTQPTPDIKLPPRSPLTLALHEHRLWSTWADRQNDYVSLVPHSPVLPRFVPPKTDAAKSNP
eukprot:GILK01003888.1.p1 GENE.GILK01003888.1~~GILK01003888.1.p1  ORF type:complete len:641 (+),score=84.89 GILK01003888.1:47-1924(+)